MEPTSNLIKIAGAFVAGIVVAVGGTLIVVKSNSMIHQQAPAAQAAQVGQQAPPLLPGDTAKGDTAKNDSGDLAQQAPETSAEEAKPEPPSAKPVAHAKKPIAKRHGPVAESDEDPKGALTPPPVSSAPPENKQVAQNTPPPPQGNETPNNQPLAGPDAPLPPPPPRQPMSVTLTAGTTIPIRLSETLSTDHNYSGDTFRGVLDQPIIINGFIIADKGSKVLGQVVDANKAGHFKGSADLTLTLTEINTTDGQRIRVETSQWSRTGRSNTGESVAKVGGGAALGAIIGAIAGGGKGAAIGAGAGGAAGTGVALATHGKPSVLPVETHITFNLQHPVTITEKLSQS